MIPMIGWLIVSFAVGYLIGDIAIRWSMRHEYKRLKTIRELLDEIDRTGVVSDC